MICTRQNTKHLHPNPSSFTSLQLLEVFLQTLPARALLEAPALKSLRFYQRLYCPLVTLWYMLFQWIHHDHTLEAVVTDARAGGADRINPKLSKRISSCSTGPYSDARTRMPENFLAQTLCLQGKQLTQHSSSTLWKSHLVVLLDGSTIRLRPHGDIPGTFVPHGNQHLSKTYWCLMRVVVSFCCFTGVALGSAMGATAVSEQALACKIIVDAAGECLFVGDRNFGVFRIVQVARAAGKHVLVRMSDVRAAKLLGAPLRAGDFALTWKPTRHDQLQPNSCKEPIAGRLIVTCLDRAGFRPQWLCLFTTLTDTQQYRQEELFDLYGQRWHAELDLRYVKAQMGAFQLEVYSAAMARKQWLTCLLAYNLIRGAMLCAALRYNISPLTLSFSASRRCLEVWLRKIAGGVSKTVAEWYKTLARINQCRLPKRKKPRPNEPRATRHIRESFPPLVGSRAKAREQLKPSTAKS